MPDLTTDEAKLRLARQRLIEALTDDDIAAVGRILTAESETSASPQGQDSGLHSNENECHICNFDIGERRDDGSIEMGVKLHCGHYFGYKCLTRAVQRTTTCPLCRVDIPREILDDLRPPSAELPAHSGRSCNHDTAFDDREFAPDVSYAHFDNLFDVEYVRPDCDTAFTYLLCPATGAVNRCCGIPKFHFDDVVVALGTSCRADSTPLDYLFSYAIWYGPRQDHSGLRPDNELCAARSKTFNGATLEAARTAVESYHRFIEQGVRQPGGRLVLKTDSDYFCRSFTQYLDLWLENGWKNLQGRPVKNKDLWQRLYSVVESLRLDFDTVVYVWEVDEEQNAPANSLAFGAMYTDGVLDRNLSDFRTALNEYEDARKWHFKRVEGHNRPHWLRILDETGVYTLPS